MIESTHREHGGASVDERRDADLRQRINTRFLGQAAAGRLHAVANTRPYPLDPLAPPIELVGATMKFCANAEIYGEGEPAEYFYQVVTGSVRTFRVLRGGRRQISGFYLPDDLFGLEPGDEHSHSAEAIVDSRVVVMKRSTMLCLAARNDNIALQLCAVARRELARAQAHALLLFQSAQGRVAGFLLDMASRSPQGDTIELPMSRRDIADFLGLTIETVSRTLTSLESEATIALSNARRIVLRNRLALSQMNA